MADDIILYETAETEIATITLNRPDARNAQNTALLHALNQAFDRAVSDTSVKVIILRANGPHFSAGHDLRETKPAQSEAAREIHQWEDFDAAGQAGMMGFETEVYFGLSERWRNIPKPTIAAVQGKCIAGGLMLAWPCDIIVASEDAEFIDNTLMMGIPGTEWFSHPFELGARKAKEMLFTGDPVSAADAYRLGLVSHVVATDALAAFVEDLAKRIARHSAFALKLAKESVNGFQDTQGRLPAMRQAFASHQLAHSHSSQVFGMPIDPSGLNPAVIREGRFRNKDAEETNDDG